VAGVVGPLRVVPVPCGLWVRHDDGGPLSDSLVYAVPADPAEVLLVVGAPGMPALDPAAVADVADELPANLGSRLVLVPHAEGSAQILSVARELVRRWRREVTVSTGLPVVASDGSRSVVATGNDGEPLWRPFMPRLTVMPGGGPPELGAPREAARAVAGLDRREPGRYGLAGPWVAEVCWAGLWVRHADRPGTPPALGDTAWDAQWLTVLADPDVPEPALTKLVEHLPKDAGSRLRVQRTGQARAQ